MYHTMLKIKYEQGTKEYVLEALAATAPITIEELTFPPHWLIVTYEKSDEQVITYLKTLDHVVYCDEVKILKRCEDET